MSGDGLECTAMQKYLHRSQRRAGSEGDTDERHYRKSKLIYASAKMHGKLKFRRRRILYRQLFWQGSNIQLTCMTPNMRNIGIGFGWTKNRALLKLEPGRAVWEDLYPAGSILKITNIQVEKFYITRKIFKLFL